MQLWFWILGWLLSILAMTGNGFIIFLVCSKRQLRTKTNAFIVSLAVADFCVGMITVPSLFVCESLDLCNNRPISMVVWIIRNLFAFASVANLCSLVLDRYIAIVKPLKYLTIMKRRRVIQMVILSWVIPTTIMTFAANVILNTSFSQNLNIPKNTLSVMFISFEIFSSFVLICVFTSMLKVVFKHNRATRSLAKQLRFNHQVSFKTQEKSAIIMMGIVVGLFLMCYGSFMRCSLIRISGIVKACNDREYRIILLGLNSATNPLAYSFFKRDIKKDIKRRFCCPVSSKSKKIIPLNKSSFSSSLTAMDGKLQ